MFGFESTFGVPELKRLSEAGEVEYGRLIFGEVEKMLAARLKELKDHSCATDDENIKRDFRYLRGAIHDLEAVLDLPEKAKRALTTESR